MTNREILQIAMEQSALDTNCCADDFKKTQNIIVSSEKNPKARKYLELPFVCNLISYGNNIVASVDTRFKNIVWEYIQKYPTERCFETPGIYILNEAFSKYDMQVCFMAEYFLPDVTLLSKATCPYEIKILSSNEFQDLYTSQWSNALCKARRELDVLGAGAYKGNQLIGLAGCSADCESMWQIGIDVLPEFRRQGIASALTSRLACEALDRGKVPFYCCAWSNIASAKNAIKSGFRPAWLELTVKSRDFADKIAVKQQI